nr:MAG TPA: hypothetical protein [Caudoviricetes sp.]
MRVVHYKRLIVEVVSPKSYIFYTIWIRYSLCFSES